MRILIIIIFVICFNEANCQQTKEPRKNSHRNQFDFGVNFSTFFDRYGFTMDNDIASFPNEGSFLKILGSFHFGYKRFFGKNICALVNYQNYDFAQRKFDRYLIEKPPVRGDLMWRSGYKYIGAGLGYVYSEDVFQSVFSLQVGYAANDLHGARAIFWGQTTGEFMQPTNSSIYYTDKYGFGISPSADINIFVFKNIGIGANFFLNYFPFAKSTFEGADRNIIDLNEADIQRFNRPANVFLSTNVKLAYRFKDPMVLK